MATGYARLSISRSPIRLVVSVPPQVGCSLATGQWRFDRLSHLPGRFRFLEMVQHHGGTEDSRHRIGNSLAGDTRGGTVGRQKRGFLIRIRTTMRGRNVFVLP